MSAITAPISAPMAPVELAFLRRRVLLAWVCVAVLVLLPLGFGLRFALQGQRMMVLLQMSFWPIAGAAALMLWREQVRAACLFLIPAAALAITLNGWWVDLPMPGVPRSTHLYLIALLLLGRFWLSRESRMLRSLTSAGLLLLLGLLSALPNPFDNPQLLPLEERRMLAYSVAVLAAGLIWLVVGLQQADLRDQARMELDLAAAIANERLELHYQPQCDAAGRPVGLEALVRWRHPQHGPVSPASFVPLAERTGLILPLGEQVMRAACRFAQRIAVEPGFAGLCIAVNVSAAQFQDETAFERLLQLVRDARLPAKALKFELTESLLVGDVEALRRRLQRCRELGIATSLDDFGTGYSSLSTLSQLPFDQLKIDQSFVKDLGRNPRCLSIAETVLQLGQQLGMEVIAEGVESAEQLELLQRLGCGRFQGFWFARPLTADDCWDWLKQRQALLSTTLPTT